MGSKPLENNYIVGALYRVWTNWRAGPSPSGRGRREAPGEGRKSNQILRPSPYLSQRERVNLPGFEFFHSSYDRPYSQRYAASEISFRVLPDSFSSTFEISPMETTPTRRLSALRISMRRTLLSRISFA